MKARRSIVAGIILLAGICIVLYFLTDNPARRELEETRRELARDGFKTRLSEFNLSVSADEKQRGAVLATTTREALTNRFRPEPILREPLPLLKPAGPGTALVSWKLKTVRAYYRQTDLWEEFRSSLETNRTRFERARQAALSGPIRFEPIGGPNALLPYLADLRSLAQTFSSAALLSMHDRQPDEAWTNLLAVTCLATAYAPEPITVSHLARYGCAGMAYDTAWNLLQAHSWTDNQLAELQRRWEAAEFWQGLPDTAAYSRAEGAALFQLYRKETTEVRWMVREAWRRPKSWWPEVRALANQFLHKAQGSYEDEKDLLLYYRDRERELQQAVRSVSWSDMRRFPGVTNHLPFVAKHPSGIQTVLNHRSLALAWQGRGVSLLGRAAEAETRRRLLITGVALERHKLAHGAYPESLTALDPKLLHPIPSDFMTGAPLKYRPWKDGRFLLYSTGLDCDDDGGIATVQTDREAELDPLFGARPGTDLLWPLPATDAEATALERAEQEEVRARERALEVETDEARWEETARRQARAERILRAGAGAVIKSVRHRGRPLAQLLANAKVTGTNSVALRELLTLRPSPAATEPEIVTFELPIDYDALTNLGSLHLAVDPVADDDAPDEGCSAGLAECKRAANGNCLLVWNTIYEAPGLHALQVGVVLDDAQSPNEVVLGPMSRFVVSNLCQFSLSSAVFTPGSGCTLRARLPETNATFQARIKLPDGTQVRTLQGTTTNGLLTVLWDLRDDRGRPCTNSAYDTVFTLILSDSGRRQTLRGP
jgi:hypothetical protein